MQVNRPVFFICIPLSTVLLMSLLVFHVLAPQPQLGSITQRKRDLEWNVPGANVPVLMSVQDTVHYALDTSLGDLEWNSTLPNGGGIIHLEEGDELRPFSVSMFHQIRCLNIIRENLPNDIISAGTSSRADKKTETGMLVTHCMNYLRQMVLCRANLRLEWVRAPRGKRVAVSDITHKCRDWSSVYEAAENNYSKYSNRKGV